VRHLGMIRVHHEMQEHEGLYLSFPRVENTLA
jgi:hypothetical protein